MSRAEVYAMPSRRSVGHFHRVDIGAKKMARHARLGFRSKNMLGRKLLRLVKPAPNGGLRNFEVCRHFLLCFEAGADRGKGFVSGVIFTHECPYIRSRIFTQGNYACEAMHVRIRLAHG